MYCSVCNPLYVCGYTLIQIYTTTFVESKVDIVVIKIDFVSYYRLHHLFLIEGHIRMVVNFNPKWRNLIVVAKL